MHSRTSKRLRTVLVLASVGLALVVTSACTSVVGLTGYEFVDGAAEAPPPDAAGTICESAFAGYPSGCAACGAQKCCEEALRCAEVSGCATRAKTNGCTGAGDLACNRVTSCVKNKCRCGG